MIIHAYVSLLFVVGGAWIGFYFNNPLSAETLSLIFVTYTVAGLMDEMGLSMIDNGMEVGFVIFLSIFLFLPFITLISALLLYLLGN